MPAPTMAVGSDAPPVDSEAEAEPAAAEEEASEPAPPARVRVVVSSSPPLVVLSVVRAPVRLVLVVLSVLELEPVV